MTALACVTVVCASALFALRMILEARRPPPASEDVRARLEALEQWRSRQEMGKLR